MALKGYTFSRMKVGSKEDALLGHFLGFKRDSIIQGYKDELKVTTSGLNAYINPGGCVVQGRLIELDSTESLTIPANTSGHICIVVDLSQTNTSVGAAGTPEYLSVNNQVRLEIVKDLIQQDLHNDGKIYTFSLAGFTANGTTITLSDAVTIQSINFGTSIGTPNGMLWNTGILRNIPNNSGNMAEGKYWTSKDNFPYGLTFSIVTGSTITNSPFQNAGYIIMSNGYFFGVLALQLNGTGIKYITGISTSTGLTWQNVKS